MNKYVECYLTRNYYELLAISKKVTKKNIDISKELLHEVILQLYNKKEIKLDDYSDDSIKYYITSILRINFYSNTSPYHYRIRKERMLYTDISDIMDIEEPQEKFESELLYKLMETSYAELDWFRKSLLDMYLTLNSLKAVSKKTTIPLTSISRYIKEGKEQIKNNIIQGLYE